MILRGQLALPASRQPVVRLLPRARMRAAGVKQCLCVCVCLQKNIGKCFKQGRKGVYRRHSQRKTISINHTRTFLYLVQVQVVLYAVISATSYCCDNKYINIPIYCQSNYSISMTIFLIKYGYIVFAQYHNYRMHIVTNECISYIYMCSSSFTHLWLIVWSKNIQLCEPVLCMLLY